jgi:hypothetical protein
MDISGLEKKVEALFNMPFEDHIEKHDLYNDLIKSERRSHS